MSHGQVPDEFKAFNLSGVSASPKPASSTGAVLPLQSGTTHNENYGFWQGLFDTSFESPITPMLVRGGYLTYLIVSGFIGIALLFAAPGPVLLRLLVVPMLYVLFAVSVRITCEGMLTLHNIERYSRQSAQMNTIMSAIERNTRSNSETSK